MRYERTKTNMTTANTENVNFSIMDLYDRIYVNNRTFGDEEYVLNCPTDKPYGKTCYDCVYECAYSVFPDDDSDDDYYIYCNRKFTDILDGWNIKTDRILDIVKNEYGIITKVTALKNRKQKTFIYAPSKIGDTLSKLVYNTKSACIIVLNQRTRNEFKIGTRYYQRHRDVPIEGYLRKNYYDEKGNYHNEFNDDRLPIYYANKPEWIIVWEREG